MPEPLQHGLRFDHARDSVARQDFVIGLRRYALNDLAEALRRRYDDQVAPAFERRHGRPFASQDEIHQAMLGNTTFQFFSATRYNAQEMSWRSVIPEVGAHLSEIENKAAEITGTARGSLTLDPELQLPKNVTELDVHLMPGGYESRGDYLAGAVYDNGLTVFSAGFLGPHIDDIGQSFAHYVRERFPDFSPGSIVDCGCTVGHNSVPWAQAFPEAETHAIDVAAAPLRYGHARAESMGVPIHFHQMDATKMTFADESMDLVVSAQFLHELSLKDTAKYLAECHRVLRPGGMLITMELAPARYMQPYDCFYLDWDAYYNREPFYRAFRNADAAALAKPAGFDPADYFEFTVPQYTKTDPAEFTRQVAQEISFEGYSGQLRDGGMRYFGFGFRK
jgi:SAM-dependent methyltransferase